MLSIVPATAKRSGAATKSQQTMSYTCSITEHQNPSGVSVWARFIDAFKNKAMWRGGQDNSWIKPTEKQVIADIVSGCLRAGEIDAVEFDPDATIKQGMDYILSEIDSLEDDEPTDDEDAVVQTADEKVLSWIAARLPDTYGWK